MPSFDIVCELDHHELTNAIDQANREISTRFDFKGSNAEITQNEKTLTFKAQSDFQLKQMADVLENKLSKRGIPVLHLDYQDPVLHHNNATQEIKLNEGIATEDAKSLVKLIKNAKLKVQASIQGEQVRVTGKKRDDLQEAIQLLKEDKTIKLPLQYINFRD
jgi:uncharacterized protein YajQ (UPF0234 family)